MSSIDPLSAIAAEIAAMQSAGADASLDLGAVAQVLQAQLSAGDVLAATVLAPKGGQDLIQILGQTVVAQLPPDVHPGDELLLQVTGFSGNQILVRNLGVQDPQNPIPTFALQLPPQAAQGTASSATLTTIVLPQPGTQAAAQALAGQSQANQPTPGLQQAAPPSVAPGVPVTPQPPVAPPREVFVAASVVRPAPDAPPPGQSAPPPAVPRTQTPPQVQQPADVEARIAAARAGQTARPPAPPAPATGAATARAQAPAERAHAQQAPQVPPVKTQAFSQTVFAKPALTVANPTVAHAAPAPQPAAAPGAPAVQHSAPAAAVSRAQLESAVASKEPVRILAALRIPATPVTLAAARSVSTASQQIALALQNLERALSQPVPADARISTLQNVISFITHLDPRNSQAFPAQISAFVSNVLEGAENKLAQLLAALTSRGHAAARAAQVPGQPVRAGQGQAPEQSAAALPAPVPGIAGNAAPAHTPVLAEARAAERQMAMTQDVKSTLLSLLQNPPAGTSPQLTQALNDTLTALTAMQFNTLIANQTDPRALTLTIPLMFYADGQAAHIRVQRDAPQKKEALDADNFHIAFVLDTATLGTVAIDLETVGRAVKVAVKTDRASAVDRFKTSLGDLTSRLEQLRYRVSSAGADMVAAPKTQAIAGQAAPAEMPAPESKLNVDTQA